MDPVIRPMEIPETGQTQLEHTHTTQLTEALFHKNKKKGRESEMDGGENMCFDDSFDDTTTTTNTKNHFGKEKEFVQE